MGEKIVVGPIDKGLRKDRTAFVIDNDSFPTLINAYQWRGRVKRKRGTSLLNRLQRFFNSTITSYSSTATLTLSSGNQNLITGFGLETNANIVPGVTITDVNTGDVYTDFYLDGNLIILPSIIVVGTINYASGAISIVGGGSDVISAKFQYNPNLPVLGLESLALVPTEFPGDLAFDNKYSYNIVTAAPYYIYDVSFYKNPAADATNLPGYVPKSTPTPTTWNGQDYQQFWSTNYQAALWVTNGIDVPFTGASIGMQFKPIVAVTRLSATTANLQINGHGLVIGDFVFVNEVITTTGINFQTGYVTTVTDANNVIVTFPFANIVGNGTGGIAQYLTNRSDTTKDCLRWYDGDPTNGNANNPGFLQGSGWVNFAPPLSQSSFTIADNIPRQYYLVGARMIVPFKDRLLFLGPVIQASSGSPIYLQDTVIYSQNGTPYYTCSFSAGANYPLPPTTNTGGYSSILLPVNQTATPSAYFEDQSGFGGFIQAGLDQPLITVSANEDALIMGFSTIQTRFIYSGSDLVPFNFFVVNSELGSGSTFSAVNMDQGVISRGTRGFIITGQTQAQRIDLDIPDQVFELNLLQNGNERFCAQRDFINEWIYFTYPVNTIDYRYPNQTLQYNYRDNSWAIFFENYTTYGTFTKQSGPTWATIGLTYPTWEVWNTPWNEGDSTALQPRVIAGNQQGFVLIRDEGTGEGASLYIQSFSGNTVTSPDHCLNNEDYIIIDGCLGSIETQVNGLVFQVANATQNTFQLDPAISSGTYLGGGTIKRQYVPFIQTKQFPVAWDMSRKTRLGPQQYLLTTTPNGQITLLIFLSQDDSTAWNDSKIVPNPLSINNSLIYSTTLYTCPESTNLGLTPANINLQMVTANRQAQTWHRMNTSLIGDTVQIGFTLSDDQMRQTVVAGPAFVITGATNANPCVLTCSGNFPTGQLITITNVNGMTQLNGNTYEVLSSNSTTVKIDVDSSAFGSFTSSPNSLATPIGFNAFQEIELHSMILDVNPSWMLA